jgi:hypothetical protein
MGQACISEGMVLDEAKRRGFRKPHPEVACLVHEAFSNEDLEAMGLYEIVVFHEPIKNRSDEPQLLSVRCDLPHSWLDAHPCVRSSYGDAHFNRGCGFAFEYGISSYPR